MSKKTVSDLALFGGPVEFAADGPLHVGRPNVPTVAVGRDRIGRAEFYALLDQALESRMLSNDGPLVRLFEEKLCAFLGVRNAVAVSSGTVGLQIALRSVVKPLEMARETVVIMPAWTFVATAHAATWLGMPVAFVDVKVDTQNVAYLDAMKEMQKSRRVFLGVHLWGRPCDPHDFDDLGKRLGVPVVFDAAPAFGCSHDGKMVGNFGACEAFSFHATKVINTFEGGAVTTNDDGLARELRRLRNFGFAGEDEVAGLGTNGKMSEAHAAMGLATLDEYPTWRLQNWARAYDYWNGLSGVEGVSFGSPPPGHGQYGDEHNWQYVQVLVEPQGNGFCRDDLWRVLKAEGVLARRYYHPGVHRMESYRTWHPDLSLPNTDWLAARSLVLPTGPSVSKEQVERVCGLVRFAVEHGEEIHDRIVGQA